MQKEVLLNEMVCLAMMKSPPPRTNILKTKDRPCGLPRALRAFPLRPARGWYKRFKEMAAKFKTEKKRKKGVILCIQRGWSVGEGGPHSVRYFHKKLLQPVSFNHFNEKNVLLLFFSIMGILILVLMHLHTRA